MCFLHLSSPKNKGFTGASYLDATFFNSNNAMLPSSAPVQQIHFEEPSPGLRMKEMLTLVRPGEDLLLTAGQSDISELK